MLTQTIEEKRQKRKKQTAEVFTPDWLAQQMLDKIPDDFWNDSSKTLLEPSCGDGVFVILSIEKRLRYGQKIKDIIKNTYAMDIMKDNVQICRERVFQIILRELRKEYFRDKKTAYNKKFNNEEELLKEIIKILDHIYEELVEITCFLLHNIFRVNDTLTFDFENFKPWEEIGGKNKQNHNIKVKRFLEQKFLIKPI